MLVMEIVSYPALQLILDICLISSFFFFFWQVRFLVSHVPFAATFDFFLIIYFTLLCLIGTYKAYAKCFQQREK